MSKIILTFFIFIIVHGCSYEPILKDKKYDFKFKSINLDKENKTNNILKNNLLEKSKNSSKKEYDLYLITSQEKEIISSNKQGDPTIFQIKISLNYLLKENDKLILKDVIHRQITYNNINDKHELLKYEENILRNLLESISLEILMSINNNF